MVRDIVVEWEGVPRGKVSVIPYGQTTERFAAVASDVVKRTRSELQMDDQLSLVCVSRLFHRKGHVYLFEALAPLIRDGLRAKLYLVGTGDYGAELGLIAESLGIRKNIEFLGWRDDVLALIAAADLIVHPSLEDALSQSLIESLMLGRPVIATNISGASDTLDGGKYGRLVRPADSDDLRWAIKEVVDDLESANERAAKGKEYLLQYMDADKVANQHTVIYQRLLDK
jgi:glycosyltransferase involved in cell wall biosynthesis